VRNPAKNVNKSVRERAARMVVAAYVQFGHVVPKIEVDVVLFTLVISLILVHTGACYDQELVF